MSGARRTCPVFCGRVRPVRFPLGNRTGHYPDGRTDRKRGKITTTNKDPYDLPVRGVNNPEHCRDITKLFLLLSLNASDKPILTVHDSFIAQIGEEDRLNQLMKEAFEDVTHKAGIKAKDNQNLTKTQVYAHGAQDRDWFLDMFQSLFKGSPTNGYQRRLERHRKYFGQ